MWSLLFTQCLYCKMKGNFVCLKNERECVYQQSNLLPQWGNMLLQQSKNICMLKWWKWMWNTNTIMHDCNKTKLSAW